MRCSAISGLRLYGDRAHVPTRRWPAGGCQLAQRRAARFPAAAPEEYDYERASFPCTIGLSVSVRRGATKSYVSARWLSTGADGASKPLPAPLSAGECRACRAARAARHVCCLPAPVHARNASDARSCKLARAGHRNTAADVSFSRRDKRPRGACRVATTASQPLHCRARPVARAGCVEMSTVRPAPARLSVRPPLSRPLCRASLA